MHKCIVAYCSKSITCSVYWLQTNRSYSLRGTPIKASSPAPPDKLMTATAEGPKSRVCDKERGIRFLVMAVGLAFICILVVTCIRMWSPQNKVE